MTTEQLVLPGERHQGWMVLIGGGEFSFGETEEFDRLILDKAPRDNRKIAFLPTASASTEYGRHLGEYFRGLDPSTELENVPVYRTRDAKRLKNAERVKTAGIVYIGGGVTNPLVTTISGTVVESAIREVLDRGGVVAAIGAAASAVGSLARSMLTVGAPIDGLGWLPGVLVEAGVRGPSDRRFQMLMGSPTVSLGVGIPSGTALAIGPDRAGLVLGDGEIVVLRKGPGS